MSPKKSHRKYLPLLFFIIMVVLTWLEEIVFVEGVFHHYLYEEQHYILRSVVRVSFVIILFLLGYKGLSYLDALWTNQLWIAWYSIVLASSGIRMLPLLLFHYQIPLNIWSFLNSLYALGLTPIPYLFIYTLWVIVAKKHRQY